MTYKMTYVTSGVTLISMENFYHDSLSIHRNFYQNWFIDESAKKNLDKI